jgi:hypothetical protein
MKNLKVFRVEMGRSGYGERLGNCNREDIRDFCEKFIIGKEYEGDSEGFIEYIDNWFGVGNGEIFNLDDVWKIIFVEKEGIIEVGYSEESSLFFIENDLCERLGLESVEDDDLERVILDFYDSMI